MAHANNHSAYSRLSERLNRFPQGAPPSQLLFAILKMLFTEKETDLVARLPIRPFTAEETARAWKLDLGSARKILDDLAERAKLLDMPQNGEVYNCLPPPMAGFFEFSMMRLRQYKASKVMIDLFPETALERPLNLIGSLTGHHKIW